MADFETVVPRPRDTTFDCTRLQRDFDWALCSVIDGARRMRDAGSSAG